MKENFLEKLRKKPKNQRRIIAFSGSLIVTAFIFIFWIFAGLPQFSSRIIAEDKDSFISPLASVKEGLSQTLELISEEFSLFKERIKSSAPELKVPDEIREEWRSLEEATDNLE